MPENVNPLDARSAINAMRETTGWKLFMERYAKEGDEILSKILDPDLTNQHDLTTRDLLVYQLEALGRVAKVLDSFEIDAKNFEARNRESIHKGN